MHDKDWRYFLSVAQRVLGPGTSNSSTSQSWCAWTTFSSLQSELNYWTAGLPDERELLESHVADGGTWGQPFKYSDIAHLIIPAQFYWESLQDRDNYKNGIRTQNIAKLAEVLSNTNIPFRITELVLELKLY